ncbi:hypothetical protein [Epilithonimonas arachidiradicis]|uniref:LysM domain-containing protein n=1 Tax=Epilithonimonas arachidiradicis TaxID=1617282 RepID=A0A420DEL0_9FLAO|nr:hypothetical protein [Epilithonimonas arachidiradicis]RKE89999.1 hypothetical protein BXY58_0584 [Epilithonimonas arachidiradicis]GGG46943.1 hypothetical protein GCM10007332_05590 [Epilithonimonas arachidiradicis]
MAITVIVLHNQSLLDVAIQHTGSVQNAFEIAAANEMSLTDQLTAGKELIIPDSITQDVDIKNYYQSRAIQPATDITQNGESEEQPEGISVWILNQNFIVQ